jgi:hypothetical protein
VKSFSQVIFKVGINPCVVPPPDVLSYIFKQAKKRKGPIPVRGTINGAQYIQTLVVYLGYWRLYVNGPMLKNAGLRNGDVASITIEFDPSSRIERPHKEFAAALQKSAKATAAFYKLTPSHQKEINRYLNRIKTDATRKKNIGIVMSYLRGEKPSGLHAVLRVPRT